MTQRIGPAGGAAADDGSALEDPDAGDWLKGFTPEASEAFAALVDGYVRDLERSSRSAAARQFADMVSRSHVQRAAVALAGAESTRWGRMTGVLGGLFLGVAVSHWVSMTSSSTYTDIGVSLTFGLAVAGTACVWHHVMRGQLP